MQPFSHRKQLSKFIAAVCLLPLFSFSGLLQASTPAVVPEKLVFCHEDQNAYPWVFPHMGSYDGLNIRMLNQLSRQLEVTIELIGLPWKRCLAQLQQNEVNGAFAASFKKERLNMGLYPITKAGDLDANQRIHMSGYSLYILKGSALGWNGEGFFNLKGDISIQNGFSIGDRLKELGIKPIEFKNPKDSLLNLKAGNVEGAALQPERTDKILKKHPELAKHIEKYPVPISQKPYYVMISFELAKDHPKFVETFWYQLSQLRESKTMDDIESRFYEEF